jgi:EAL domain-containing protein (putative c-di-GMP-specific phosphodiesterase class I)
VPADNPTAQPEPTPPGDRLRVVSLLDRGGLLERLRAQRDSLRVMYTPIVDVGRGAVAGYEAKAALGDGDALSPRGWSIQAHEQHAGDVESVVLPRLIAARAELPPNAFLLVTVSGPALSSGALDAEFEAAGALDRLVLAVHDAGQGEQAHALARKLEPIRAAGATIAVDETGSGYGALRQILAVRPEFVRVGGGFVADVDRDLAKAAVVEMLGGLASRIDAWVIADGVSVSAELNALRRMGVPLGQGELFGGAQPEMAPLGRAAAQIVAEAGPAGEPEETVAGLIEAQPALPWGCPLEDVADAFLDNPRNDVLVLVDEQSRPLALADRAALLRGEVYERPVMRITPSTALKAVARRAAARPAMERFHPLVACDKRGVYLGIVRIEQLLDALGR